MRRVLEGTSLSKRIAWDKGDGGIERKRETGRAREEAEKST